MGAGDPEEHEREALARKLDPELKVIKMILSESAVLNAGPTAVLYQVGIFIPFDQGKNGSSNFSWLDCPPWCGERCSST